MLKDTAIRIYVTFLYSLFIITGGISMFVLAPFYKHAFAPFASYRDFDLPRIWLHMYKILWRSISRKSYRDMYPARLTDPPMYANDTAVMQIRSSWAGGRDDCDACPLSCCEQIECPMYNNRRCLAFGSWYFGYYYCGRYPSNKAQMQLYNCPKWGLRSETA